MSTDEPQLAPQVEPLDRGGAESGPALSREEADRLLARLREIASRRT